jgi:hypothetical protein
MSEHRVVCHACATALDYDGILPRASTCAGCGADLRCCLDCTFYDPAAYNDCREPSADRVLEKDRANFCDYFRPADHSESDRSKSSDDPKSELEKLFAKK